MATSKTFSKNWWRSFYETTNKMTSQALIPAGITTFDQDILKQGVFEVIKNMIQSKVDFGFRISVNGDVDKKYRSIIYRHPPESASQLAEWAQNIFGESRFGLILNNAQNYSFLLKKEISRMCSPLIDLTGVPRNGLELTLFIGNYGFTPIGFHIDPPGHKVLHLHLGPGTKTMFLMNKEDVEREFGEISTLESGFERLLPKCKKYDIQKGDCFYMPPGMFHIGRSDHLSIAITVWHIDPRIYEYKQKLKLALNQKLFPEIDNDVLLKSSFDKVSDNSLASQHLREHWPINNELLSGSLENFLDDLMAEDRYRLFSNGFFKGYYSEKIANSSAANFDDKVRGIIPFKVYYRSNTGYGQFFVQGKCIEVPCMEIFNHIAERINTYKPYTLYQMFYELIESDLDQVHSNDFIQAVLHLRGLEIVNKQ